MTLAARTAKGIKIAIIGFWLVTGCHINEPVYLPAPMILEADSQTGPSQNMGGASGAGSFGAKGRVALKLRAETSAENKERSALSNRLGYPVEVPQLRADRLHMEIRYTVTNVSDEPGKFTLHVDGADEFTRYDEDAVASALVAADEDAQFFGLIEPTPMPLAPGATYQGVVREDDFYEAALDLDAVGRFMAPFLAVTMNRSEVNPTGLELLPASFVRPALWEVTLQFAATQRMTCQFLVRVRDDDNRLWSSGDDEFVPQPATYTPTIPAP